IAPAQARNANRRTEPPALQTRSAGLASREHAMFSARAVLYTVLVMVNVAAILGWIALARRRELQAPLTWADVAIGAVTNFLDTLGIGSYAQITALFKLRGKPADELIPGTLNVGSTAPAFLGSLLFFGAIAVEPVLLASMVISSGLGAWIGAGV